ncbi:holin [Corynebacterium oculi]|uniref:Holin family protein n=1 Tax=Corynebacterium oculi TaxID=1544416 RepID=A0A0Q1DXN3_9CORY|nr:holin [Corynebacterium oculi]KQB85016.1 hypothetical protein Cocul_00149 [Corynebacterium oculi]
MWTKGFWVDTVERAIKTLAQALIAVLAVGTPIYDLAWGESLGIAATAAVISVLTSIVSVGVGETDTAAALPRGERD